MLTSIIVSTAMITLLLLAFFYISRMILLNLINLIFTKKMHFAPLSAK
jgi:hypothetical protein